MKFQLFMSVPYVSLGRLGGVILGVSGGSGRVGGVTIDGPVLYCMSLEWRLAPSLHLLSRRKFGYCTGTSWVPTRIWPLWAPMGLRRSAGAAPALP